MKKIVSVLSVAALTLSAVFAADVSLKYNMKEVCTKRPTRKLLLLEVRQLARSAQFLTSQVMQMRSQIS